MKGVKSNHAGINKIKRWRKLTKGGRKNQLFDLFNLTNVIQVTLVETNYILLYICTGVMVFLLLFSANSGVRWPNG